MQFISATLTSLFLLLQESNKMSKRKLVLGTASLNLADYASAAEEEIEIILPLSVPSSATDLAPSLHVCLLSNMWLHVLGYQDLFWFVILDRYLSIA